MSTTPDDAGAAAGARILVVDDEPNIADVVSMALRFHGFEVETAGTGEEALAAVERFRPQLMVLDVMLPDMEGFEVAQRLGAERSRVPIMFLTARDAAEDKLRGLTTGGDDYMTKPFSLEELVARMRGLLRRAKLAESEPAELLSVGDLTLDNFSRTVTRGGVEIGLTTTEFELLRYLMRHPGRAIPRDEILDQVWNYGFGGRSSIVDLYISYLRKKLDNDQGSMIHTVRGIGYSLRAAT